jgi:dTDP-4-dehydrorhamnose 3,5-epimerase
MRFHPSPLPGVCTVEPDRRDDSRGFFARLFCEQEFAAAGLERKFVQINNSLTAKKGTLRGLHYQLPPCAETKLVRCVRGALYDVAVDLRPDSPTFRQWFGATLDAVNCIMMYVPRGFAHAFITLTDDVETIYFVSSAYSPDNERGLRWNDPALGIPWPIAPVEISEKDRNWPDLDNDFHGLERLRGL